MKQHTGVNAQPGMLLPFVTKADISPKMPPCGSDTALAVSSSVGGTGAQGKGFCKLREVHELEMESPYPSPPFPEQELGAWSLGRQCTAAELQVAMGIAGGGMVSSGFSRPWNFSHLSPAMRNKDLASGGAASSWGRQGHMGSGHVLPLFSTRSPDPGWRGAKAAVGVKDPGCFQAGVTVVLSKDGLCREREAGRSLWLSPSLFSFVEGVSG